MRVTLGSCVLRVHAGVVHLLAEEGGREDGDIVTWQGEIELDLPQLGGVLEMTRSRGAGLSAQRHSAMSTRRERWSSSTASCPRARRASSRQRACQYEP